MNDIDVNGKVAIITGAASGIGLAVAERLAEGGASVVLSDVNEEAGHEVAGRLKGRFVGGDLSTRAGCRRLVETTIGLDGTVHVLVNNAGFQHVSPIEEFPEDVWEKMVALMLTAPFLLTRACWPHMKKQQWGRVINIASIHALVASPFKAGYVSAKHGLVGLTRAAALEGGEHGITVNAICPAYVRTPLVEKQIDAQAQSLGIAPGQVIDEVMLAPAAIKRLIEPGEVAEFVAYLCGDAASGITGVAFPMDLGWTAR